jgi:hypothetical protein
VNFSSSCLFRRRTGNAVTYNKIQSTMESQIIRRII